MAGNIEDKPIYRFFNVIFFVMYAIVILVALASSYVGYSEREVVSATVECKDGTSWDALSPKNILYDDYAKCGLCTKRTSDNKRYDDCTYKDMDYHTYETIEEKESWDWSIVVYPLIAIVIGFGLVDSIRIAILYIFTGQTRFDKSLLLQIAVLIFASTENNQDPKS